MAFTTTTRTARRFNSGLVVEALERRSLFSATLYVSTTGNDLNSGADAAHAWRHLQKAFDSAKAGSTVLVAAGRYNEKDTLHVSGSAAGGYITFMAQGHVVIDGTGRAGANLITLSNHNYIKFIGFELVNNLHVTDGSGIRIQGAGNNIILQNNTIHQISGSNAMGITIYGESASSAISNLIIDHNTIFHCQAAPSEALTLNGNVTNFQVTHNTIHDVNNIGIDFIGGEGTCPSPALDMARNGICEGNTVTRARSNYGGGYAGGIYVDGAKNITIAYNAVTQSDLGIEVGSEHKGRVVSGIVVRDNLIYQNDKAGIVFGGYDSTVGKVVNCQFLNNTLYHNDTKSTGNGEIWIQIASGCRVENNLITSTNQDMFVVGDPGSANNTINYNLYYTPDGVDAVIVIRNGVEFDGFSTEKNGSPWDHNSIFANPLFQNASALNFHLLAKSPAINAGNPTFVQAVGETDYFGHKRILGGWVDIGAIETR